MKYFLSFSVLLSVVLFPSQTYATSDCPLQVNRAYKTTDSSAVWYLGENCQKKAFKKSNIYFTYFTSWDEVLENNDIAQIPNDEVPWMAKGPLYKPAQGTVVKKLDDPKVYFLFGNKKYWIDSGDSFRNLGYQWNWVEDVDQRLLDQYEEGAEISDFDGHPPYILIKKVGDPKVYRLEPDFENDRTKFLLRHITNAEVFNDLGYRFDRVIEMEEDGFYSPFKDSVFSPKIGDPINSKEDAVTKELPHIYKYVSEELGLSWNNNAFEPSGRGFSNGVLNSVSYGKKGEVKTIDSDFGETRVGTSHQIIFTLVEKHILGTFDLEDIQQAFDGMQEYLEQQEIQDPSGENTTDEEFEGSLWTAFSEGMSNEQYAVPERVEEESPAHEELYLHLLASVLLGGRYDSNIKSVDGREYLSFTQRDVGLIGVPTDKLVFIDNGRVYGIDYSSTEENFTISKKAVEIFRELSLSSVDE